eukprot:781628-Amphidinium_carterae.1
MPLVQRRTLPLPPCRTLTICLHLRLPLTHMSTACMTRIVLAVLRDFHLPVNMSKNKTEISICFRGTRSRDYDAGLAEDARMVGLDQPVLIHRRDPDVPFQSEFVRVTRVYKYFGKLTSASGQYHLECKSRAAQALAAVHQMSKVLSSEQLGKRAKIKTVIMKA